MFRSDENHRTPESILNIRKIDCSFYHNIIVTHYAISDTWMIYPENEIFSFTFAIILVYSLNKLNAIRRKYQKHDVKQAQF